MNSLKYLIVNNKVHHYRKQTLSLQYMKHNGHQKERSKICTFQK